MKQIYISCTLSSLVLIGNWSQEHDLAQAKKGALLLETVLPHSACVDILCSGFVHTYSVCRALAGKRKESFNKIGGFNSARLSPIHL